MPGIHLQIDVPRDSKLAVLAEDLNFTEKLEFAKQLAGDFDRLTRDHIVHAAQSRHKTAQRLGASPSNYLLNKASSVEAIGSPGAVLLTVKGDIFKRTFQPVTVNAVKAKMLTIPWSAEAYGRRAGEFANLFVHVSKGGSGPAFLAQRDGGRMKFLFLLKRSVVLPQDRGLLPEEQQFAAKAEESAADFIGLQVRKLSAG